MSGQHIVIIGNGISGITCARHVRKRSNAHITVISGESDHFYSRTALMYIYMGHMRYAHTKPYEDGFWKKNRIDLVRGWVKDVLVAERHVEMDDGQRISFDKLVIATGSASNMFGWPGQDLPGVQGLYNLQDLEMMEANTKGIKEAVVVGGGLIGVEMAEMLHTRGIHVTMLVRESTFWGNVLPKEEGELVSRHLLEHGIDLRLSTELDRIEAGDDGRVSHVITKRGKRIDCAFVGLTVGVHPNIMFVNGNADINTDKGVLVNEYLETSAPDVFAIGDCAQFKEHPDPERRPIEQVWYTGRMMGETLARTLTGERTAYRPGQWFNSAKFFDIEYQTYGWVRSQLPNGQDTFYWEDPTGHMSFRAVWDGTTRRLLGVNIFGMRMRHEVFDAWLHAHVTVDQVMNDLQDAMFDPEFYRSPIKAIRATFSRAHESVETHP